MKNLEKRNGDVPGGIQIKGTGDGLTVTLTGSDWGLAKELFLNTVNSRKSFFLGARVALDTGNMIISAAEMGKLRDQLSTYGINFWALQSTANVTIKNAKSLGIIFSGEKQDTTQKNPSNLEEGEAAVLVRRTLRAGYRVETKNNVVILGDVNPGAEIITGGNLVVWGKLMGSVTAGTVQGNSAVVCALVMDPTHLRIGQFHLESSGRKNSKDPQIAEVKENEIILHSWKTKGI